MRTTRALLIRTIDPQLREAVQEVCGRRVLSVISGFNPWDDIASEAFLLENPDGEDAIQRERPGRAVA